MVDEVVIRPASAPSSLPRWRVEAIASYPARRHWTAAHRFRWYCLLVVTSGRAEVRCDGWPPRPLCRGEALLVHPGDICSYGPAAGGTFGLRYLSVSGASADAAAREGLFPAEREAIPLVQPSAVLERMARVRRFLSSPCDVDAAGVEALGIFVEIQAQRRAARRGPGQDLTTRVAADLELRLREDISIGGLAARHGVSEPYLRQAFVARLGMPPARYLARLRIDAAIRLLQEGELSVAAIGAAAGMRDASSFCRLFRRVVGCSPGGFRREHRGGGGP